MSIQIFKVQERKKVKFLLRFLVSPLLTWDAPHRRPREGRCLTFPAIFSLRPGYIIFHFLINRKLEWLYSLSTCPKPCCSAYNCREGLQTELDTDSFNRSIPRIVPCIRHSASAGLHKGTAKKLTPIQLRLYNLGINLLVLGFVHFHDSDRLPMKSISVLVGPRTELCRITGGHGVNRAITFPCRDSFELRA
jgi:hypothetical protein